MIRDDHPDILASAEPGLYRGVPESVYHSRVAGIASKSVLELIARAPAAYEAWLAGKDRQAETPTLFFGKALHMALLEPDRYRTTYTVEPNFGDCRFKEAKATRDAWRAENKSKLLLEQADATHIDGMVKSAKAHPLVSKMLCDDGVSELTARWLDDETGIVCKSRADYYVERLNLCVDIKTAEDARADAFVRSVTNYGYHRQNAFYDDGFRAVGAALEHFVFVAIEKAPPYLIGVFNLDDDAIRRGRGWARSSLRTFADCIERGEYPGYDTSIQTLSLPGWAKDAA